MKRMILIGGGGHARSIIDTIRENNEYKIAGILDRKEKLGGNLAGIEIIGTDDDLEDLYKSGIENAFIALGSIGNPKNRIRLYEHARKIGYSFPPVVDKTAIISENAVLYEGSFVGKGAIINTNVKIGIHAIINTGSIIEHEAIIGDFVHIGPGAVLSGNVEIGDHTHIGTNASIIQNINIGRNSLIGAGSVVVKDIKANTKAYGNPAREV